MRCIEIDTLVKEYAEEKGIEKNMAEAFVNGIVYAHLTDGQMMEIKKVLATTLKK